MSTEVTYPPGSLQMTIFDGSKWSSAEVVRAGGSSPTGMAIADHKGNVCNTLVGVFRKSNDKASNLLHWVDRFDYQWGATIVIDQQSSPFRPALAMFHPHGLFCAYRSTGDEIWLTYACLDLLERSSGDWRAPINTGGSSRTSDNPALAVFKVDGKTDHLVCVIRGTNNQVYWDRTTCTRQSSSEAITFSWCGSDNFHNGGLTNASPAIAVYNGDLYCCVRGTDNRLYWSKYSGGKWSNFSKSEESKDGMLSGPALAVYDNKLWCTYRGDQGAVCYTYFDGTKWFPTCVIPGQHCQGGKAFASMDPSSAAPMEATSFSSIRIMLLSMQKFGDMMRKGGSGYIDK